MKELLENMIDTERIRYTCFNFVYNNWSPHIQTGLSEVSEFCYELELPEGRYEMLLEHLTQLVTRFYHEGLHDGLYLGMNLEER